MKYTTTPTRANNKNANLAITTYCSRYSFSSALALGTSAGVSALSPEIVGSSGNLYSLIVRCIVMRGASREKFTVINFFGLIVLCQYLHAATGLGSTTPAV